MRQIIVLLACLGLFVSATVVATTTSPGNQSTTKAKNDSIWLYDQAKNGKVIKRLTPNVRLVPIYQRENWVKVGDPRDGQVGWINLVQYQKARYKYYRPDIQTLYVHIDANNKGKPTLNVIAYKNGKPLSQKDAIELYNRLRKQQEEQYRNMQRFSMTMEQMMDQDFLNAERFFDSAWMNPPWMEPIILIPASNDRQLMSPKGDHQASSETSHADKSK